MRTRSQIHFLLLLLSAAISRLWFVFSEARSFAAALLSIERVVGFFPVFFFAAIHSLQSGQ